MWQVNPGLTGHSKQNVDFKIVDKWISEEAVCNNWAILNPKTFYKTTWPWLISMTWQMFDFIDWSKWSLLDWLIYYTGHLLGDNLHHPPTTYGKKYLPNINLLLLLLYDWFSETKLVSGYKFFFRNSCFYGSFWTFVLVGQPLLKSRTDLGFFNQSKLEI